MLNERHQDMLVNSKMKFVTWACVLLAIVFVQCDAIKKLPNIVTQCKIKDPEISKCWKDNIKNLRPRLLKGIRVLQIPGIDPLHVTELVLGRNDSAVVSYTAVFKDLVIEGGKDFKILDLNVDMNALTFKLKLHLPNAVLKSAFIASGVMLGFPLNEPGSAVCDFSNVTISYETDGVKYMNRENVFIHWGDGKFNSSYDKLSVKIEGVLADPDQLRLFNRALNENILALAPHVDPALKGSFGTYITESLRGVHKLFPVNVLYSQE